MPKSAFHAAKSVNNRAKQHPSVRGRHQACLAGRYPVSTCPHAGMAKLAAALDLGSSGAIRGGSSPPLGTCLQPHGKCGRISPTDYRAKPVVGSEWFRILPTAAVTSGRFPRSWPTYSPNPRYPTLNRTVEAVGSGRPARHGRRGLGSEERPRADSPERPATEHSSWHANRNGSAAGANPDRRACRKSLDSQ